MENNVNIVALKGLKRIEIVRFDGQFHLIEITSQDSNPSVYFTENTGKVKISTGDFSQEIFKNAEIISKIIGADFADEIVNILNLDNWEVLWVRIRE